MVSCEGMAMRWPICDIAVVRYGSPYCHGCRPDRAIRGSRENLQSAVSLEKRVAHRADIDAMALTRKGVDCVCACNTSRTR